VARWLHEVRTMRVIGLTFVAPAAFVALAACGSAPKAIDPTAPDAALAAGDAGTDAANGATDAATGAAIDAATDAAGATEPCVLVDDTAAVYVATAATADDFALTLTAKSTSATSWGTSGNEALVLEVAGAHHGFIGHLVMHQGHATFAYGMAIGALDAGEPVSVKVSTLSAPNAVRQACVGPATLMSAADLGAAGEGLVHAPILRWPVQKSFNDLPMILGWSKARHAYQTVFTNEDGGTAEQCGGGASGMQAEIARWGRAADIEGDYSYGGAAPTWERCTGTVPVTTTALRMEAAHPILYYGDGHNRVFENRGGYGQTCGTGSPEKPDGDLVGWNTQSPSTSLADDAGRVIIVRPLPVALDALGYATFGGRREALLDTYAPWLYRITSLELAREGKIDNSKTFGLTRYLYADVRVDDVGGSGDQYCATLGVSGGFKLRAFTTAGTQIDGPQITADYASNGNHDWKRVAIPLPAGTTAADIDHFVFDAYDDDGIYLTALGDAFTVSPAGDNGATLHYVRHAVRDLSDYVDDDSSSCTSGVNTGGPGGTPYTCTGGAVTLPK